MRILVLRVNKPYQLGQPGNPQHRHRLIKPFLYSFLVATFVCELLCIVLYLTNWNFGISLLDFQTANLLAIVLQVALILLTFSILWVLFICIEAILITRFLRKNKRSQRWKQRELGLLHPDIQSIRKPLRVLYYIFLVCVILTLCAYIVMRHVFFAPSTLIAFTVLFTLMRFWHILHEKWPGKHMSGTSIADLSKYV